MCLHVSYNNDYTINTNNTITNTNITNNIGNHNNTRAGQPPQTPVVVKSLFKQRKQKTQNVCCEQGGA